MKLGSIGINVSTTPTKAKVAGMESKTISNDLANITSPREI